MESDAGEKHMDRLMAALSEPLNLPLTGQSNKIQSMDDEPLTLEQVAQAMKEVQAAKEQAWKDRHPLVQIPSEPVTNSEQGVEYFPGDVLLHSYPYHHLYEPQVKESAIAEEKKYKEQVQWLENYWMDVYKNSKNTSPPDLIRTPAAQAVSAAMNIGQDVKSMPRMGWEFEGRLR